MAEHLTKRDRKDYGLWPPTRQDERVLAIGVRHYMRKAANAIFRRARRIKRRIFGSPLNRYPLRGGSHLVPLGTIEQKPYTDINRQQRKRMT